MKAYYYFGTFHIFRRLPWWIEDFDSDLGHCGSLLVGGTDCIVAGVLPCHLGDVQNSVLEMNSGVSVFLQNFVLGGVILEAGPFVGGGGGVRGSGHVDVGRTPFQKLQGRGREGGENRLV